MPNSKKQSSMAENPTSNEHRKDLSISNEACYFDIDHLVSLAQEKSFTIPKGLTRDQIIEWAKNNLNQ